MADANGVSAEKKAGWISAALPNPFMFLDASIEEFVESSTPVLNDDSYISVLRTVKLARRQSNPSAYAVSLPPPERPAQKLRGISLLGAVFAELAAQLGGQFSTVELMKAAQQLIRISKSEHFSETKTQEVSERANYYTWDLVRAFRRHPWQIAVKETHAISHCDVEEFDRETFAEVRLIQQGWNERMWEF